MQLFTKAKKEGCPWSSDHAPGSQTPPPGWVPGFLLAGPSLPHRKGSRLLVRIPSFALNQL